MRVSEGETGTQIGLVAHQRKSMRVWEEIEIVSRVSRDSRVSRPGVWIDLLVDVISWVLKTKITQIRVDLRGTDNEILY